MRNQQKYFISSRSRVSGTSSDFIYSMNFAGQKVKGFKISNVTIPFKFYPINSTNNIIYFTEGATPATATINPGTYTPTSLATHVQAIMTAASPTVSTYTVTYNSISDQFSLAISAGTFQFTFGTNTSSSANEILGFSQQDTSARSTQTSNISPIL
jgi:hypothetical protein